jgi:predicted nucleic acid-binding protein
VLREVPERLKIKIAVLHGVDFGEASLVVAALELKGRGVHVTILTSDDEARRAAEEYGIEVHGDLYVVEQAKLEGYCSPEQAARLIELLPSIGRYVENKLAKLAAQRLRSQGVPFDAEQ